METQTNKPLPIPPAGLTDTYHSLALQAWGLMSGQAHPIANAANLSALIYHSLDDLNWVGFYFLEHDPVGSTDEVLMVGPFQGKPACVRIEVGQGVCGTAVAKGQTQRVFDVHAFEGHIACDPASCSELVVPLRVPATANHPGRIIGVLDIDSPRRGRFDEHDQIGVEYLADLYARSLA